MIHLRTFNLERINEYKHYSLIRDMSQDKNVIKYISRNFSKWIDMQVSDSDKIIEVGKSYVIERDNKYVGFVGSLEFSSNGVLEVWYAIDSEFRNKGYGERILGELTPYYIENVNGLNDICLKINKYNIASQRVAVKNGYTKVAESDDIWKYNYFGRKSR